MIIANFVRLFGFGKNDSGQLGNVDSLEELPVMIAIPSSATISKIFCGPEISAFLAGNKT